MYLQCASERKSSRRHEVLYPMTNANLAYANAKETLLGAARKLLHSGLVEGTSGNLSVRLPDGHVIMTPSSIDYDEMTVDDLVVCDLDGGVLSGERPPTSEKALHLACLNRRADINAVVHSHALYCSMFAVTRQPIPCAIEELEIHLGGDVPVADYRPTGSAALADEVSKHVVDRAAVIMANHGLLTVGKDMDEAMRMTLLVERAARIVWGARLLGELVPLPTGRSSASPQDAILDG
jgi:L-fuculose-phosphate aldolase